MSGSVGGAGVEGDLPPAEEGQGSGGVMERMSGEVRETWVCKGPEFPELCFLILTMGLILHTHRCLE